MQTKIALLQDEHLKNPYALVKHTNVVYKKYIKELAYLYVVNWVLIGSMGDPKTWKGNTVEVAIRKGPSKDGLASVLIDLGVL